MDTHEGDLRSIGIGGSFGHRRKRGGQSNPTPVLTCIKLTAEDGRMTLSASDGDVDSV